MKKLLFATVMIFSIQFASAQFLDGNDLVKLMRDYEKAERSEKPVEFMNATEFRGFVLGVHDALEAEKVLCSNDRTTKRQVGLIVVKYMNANPEQWSNSAFSLVSTALISAFPCKK